MKFTPEGRARRTGSQETIRELVNKEIAAAGIAQAAIADRLRVSPGLVCMMLAGRRALTTDRADAILAMCGAKLRISVVDLADDNEGEK